MKNNYGITRAMRVLADSCGPYARRHGGGPRLLAVNLKCLPPRGAAIMRDGNGSAPAEAQSCDTVSLSPAPTLHSAAQRIGRRDMVGKSVGQRSNAQRVYDVKRPLVICTAPKRMWFIRLGAQARGCGRISPAEAPHCRFGGGSSRRPEGWAPAPCLLHWCGSVTA